MAVIDRVRDIVEPLCLDAMLDLYDLELNGGVMRVTIDKAGGVDMTDIAQLTREISRALDEHDPINGHFTLEVSSPGLERALRIPAHYLRAVGTAVKVKLRPGAHADRRIEGVIVSADDVSVSLRIDGATDDQQFIYDDIEKARTVFAWGPTPRASDRPSTKKSANTATAQDSVSAPAIDEASEFSAVATERPAPDRAVKVVNA